MPPQAVTLEPLVHEISAQGTGPLANISEKFFLHGHFTIVDLEVLFKLRPRSLCYATLIKQCLFDGLL